MSKGEKVGSGERRITAESVEKAYAGRYFINTGNKTHGHLQLSNAKKYLEKSGNADKRYYLPLRLFGTQAELLATIAGIDALRPGYSQSKLIEYTQTRGQAYYVTKADTNNPGFKAFLLNIEPKPKFSTLEAFSNAFFIDAAGGSPRKTVSISGSGSAKRSRSGSKKSGSKKTGGGGGGVRSASGRRRFSNLLVQYQTAVAQGKILSVGAGLKMGADGKLKNGVIKARGTGVHKINPPADFPSLHAGNQAAMDGAVNVLRELSRSGGVATVAVPTTSGLSLPMPVGGAMIGAAPPPGLPSMPPVPQALPQLSATQIASSLSLPS